MLSKLVADREKSARVLGASLTAHGPSLTRQLEELFASLELSAPHSPQFERLIALLQSALAKRCQEMVSADITHSHERSNDGLPRQQRDQTVKAVTDTVSLLRPAVKSRYGETLSKLLVIPKASRRNPHNTLNWGTKVYESLIAQVRDSVPSTNDPEYNFLTHTLAKLKGHLHTLEGHLSHLAHEARQTEVTQQSKSKALENYDRMYLLTVSIFESLLRFSGEDRLADKVRPAKRRLSSLSGNSAPSSH